MIMFEDVFISRGCTSTIGTEDNAKVVKRESCRDGLNLQEVISIVQMTLCT